MTPYLCHSVIHSLAAVVLAAAILQASQHQAAAAETKPSVKITVDKTAIGFGQSIELKATAVLPNGKPAAGWTILPYVNGQRWGSHEIADANGKAVFHIPFPRVGLQVMTASVLDLTDDPSHWLWSKNLKDNQSITLLRSFTIKGTPKQSVMLAAADDNAVVKINGQTVMPNCSMTLKPLSLPDHLLKSGVNTIEVSANNGVGPAGFLFRLDVQTDQGNQLVVSDNSWTAQETNGAVEPVSDLGSVSAGYLQIPAWPGMADRSQVFTRTVMGPNQPVSNAITIDVKNRKLQMPPKDPNHLIVMQWENWYGRTMYRWDTAQAVPLMGFYETADENVMRQHIIWMIEAGTDIIQCDMSNNIWEAKDWDDRSSNANELLFVNQLMMETLAKMRDEGITVPKFMILSGTNWTENGLKVINQQLNALYQLYINNTRFSDLYYRLDGKPLVLLLDLGGKFYPQAKQIDNRWNIRFASVNMEMNEDQRNKGFWSWMDNEATSVLGPDGKPESITVPIGSFTNGGGWLHPTAHARRGGATFVEAWQTVIKDQPQHIFIHQFQEFAGQPEGQGYDENHNRYVDSYSVDLSDDLEPTSLTKSAYRGNGGWGYFYLNLNKALVSMLREKSPETTVVVVAKPDRRHEVSGNSMELQWRSVGKPFAEGVSVAIDGKVVQTGLKEQSTSLDITKLKAGLHTITITAPGAVQRYRLSWTEDSLPLQQLEPTTVTMEFIKTAAPKEKIPNAR